MGQVILFPTFNTAYPTQRTSLDDPEGVLLIGLRWWVHDVCARQDPLPRLQHGMDLAGAPDAAFAIDELMSVVARTAQRSLEIHAPLCDCMSLDEAQMLHAASLVQASPTDAQADDCARAERALGATLLTAQGADMALGPLQDIGRLFAAARLLLRRRAAPLAATLH